jgi:spore maturation protein CgeB
MKNFGIISDNMRMDWDRRVTHDYRFWITNDLASDSVIWNDGERDLDQILFGIEGSSVVSAIEIGCGVGRMLPAAARRLPNAKILGVDISPRAIEKARELHSSLEDNGVTKSGQISFLVNSGVDLSPIKSRSVDLIWSFAALPHTPTRVFAAYLSEIKRVLAESGCARLQLFIGAQDPPAERDTLRVRAYTEEALKAAVAASGLRLTGFTSVTLPLQELLDELNLVPVIITIEQGDGAAMDVEGLAKILLNGLREPTHEGISCTEFEAWLALHYADRLYQGGDIDRARNALEYVAQYCKITEFDVRDVLERIQRIGEPREDENIGEIRPSLSESASEQSYSPAIGGSDCSGMNWFASNLAVLDKKFPVIGSYILSRRSPEAEVRPIIKGSLDGAVLWLDGVPLDHPEKPIAAGDAWVKRTLNDSRIAAANHIVVLGFGTGYHLERLIRSGNRKVSCIENNLIVFMRALEARDLRGLIEQLDGLTLFDDNRYIGTEVNAFDSEAELVIRPQSIAVNSEEAYKINRDFNSRRGLKVLNPKISVLGPLHGGTLPIGFYTTTALRKLKQKVRGVDVSAFNSGYELMGTLLQNDQRQSLCRQTYVEMISSILLESFTERPIDILICMAQAPISPRALVELRKRGVITVLWFVEDYLRFTYWRETAKYFDYVFTVQKGECIDAIRRAGAANVHYLPPGCDPSVHAPLVLSEADRLRWGSPISFVGAGYHNRRQTFAGLSHLPLKIWGTEWPECKPFDRLVQESGRRLTPEEYVKIFNASDININLHSSNERDSVDPTGDFVNPRTFELAACGAFQLVDERLLLGECFEPGREIVTFSSVTELKDKIAYYAERPNERAKIAEAARRRALRDHTYDQRLQEMLTTIYATSYHRLKNREQESPWIEMIRRAEFDPELKQRCQKAFESGAEPVLDGLIADITLGEGQLTETEQKLLFLFHVRKQIVRIEHEREGAKA